MTTPTLETASPTAAPATIRPAAPKAAAIDTTTAMSISEVVARRLLPLATFATGNLWQSHQSRQLALDAHFEANGLDPQSHTLAALADECVQLREENARLQAGQSDINDAILLRSKIDALKLENSRLSNVEVERDQLAREVVRLKASVDSLKEEVRTTIDNAEKIGSRRAANILAHCGVEAVSFCGSAPAISHEPEGAQRFVQAVRRFEMNGKTKGEAINLAIEAEPQAYSEYRKTGGAL